MKVIPRRAGRVRLPVLLVALGLIGGGVVAATLLMRPGSDPAPQPAPEPLAWNEISLGAGGSRVFMPARVTEQVRTKDSPAGPLTERVFYSPAGEAGVGLELSYGDFSDDQIGRTTTEQIIKGRVQDDVKALALGVLEGQREFDIDGYRGQEALIRVPGRGLFLTRLVMVGPRLYTLSAAGPGAAPESPEVQKFFDSFRLAEGAR